MIGKIEFGNAQSAGFAPGAAEFITSELNSLKEVISGLQEEVTKLKSRIRHLEVKGMVCR